MDNDDFTSPEDETKQLEQLRPPYIKVGVVREVEREFQCMSAIDQVMERLLPHDYCARQRVFEWARSKYGGVK